MAALGIVIAVEGGVVQDVYCSDEAARVLVVDWDAESCEPGEGGVVAVPRGERSRNAEVLEPVSIRCLSWLATTWKWRSGRPVKRE